MYNPSSTINPKNSSLINSKKFQLVYEIYKTIKAAMPVRLCEISLKACNETCILM